MSTRSDPSLDEAQNNFDAQPTKENAVKLVAVAEEYFNDDIIQEDEYRNIRLNVAKVLTETITSLDVLKDLLEWEKRTGGWDADCWTIAALFVEEFKESAS